MKIVKDSGADKGPVVEKLKLPDSPFIKLVHKDTGRRKDFPRVDVGGALACGKWELDGAQDKQQKEKVEEVIEPEPVSDEDVSESAPLVEAADKPLYSARRSRKTSI